MPTSPLPSRPFISVERVLCTLPVVAVLAWASAARAVDFATNPAALPQGDARPRVIVFGATWCGWCRKLAADTLVSPLLDEQAEQFLWLKVDVDEQPALASRYGVNGLPHTIITDAAGNVIGEKSGYLPPAEFILFLTDTLKNPKTTLSDLAGWLNELKSPDEPMRREAVKKLLKQVSRVDGAGRDELIAALKEQGVSTWSEFAPYLSHPRLAVRAAAAGVLQRATLANHDFDPFAAATIRDEQSRAWTMWIESQGGRIPQVSFFDWDADATAWSLEGNADRPPAPPLASPLETPAAP